MNKGRIVVAFIVFAISFTIVQSADSTSAINDDDFKLSIPGYDWSIPIQAYIGNGHSQTYTLYITNYTDHTLDVSFLYYGDNPDIYLQEIESITVPANKDGGPIVTVEQEITICVKSVTESCNGARSFIDIRVADINDDTITLIPLAFIINVTSSFDASGNYNKFFGFIDNTLPEPFNSPFVPFFVSLIVLILVTFITVRLAVPALIKTVEQYQDKKTSIRVRRLLTVLTLMFAVALFIDPGLRILGANIVYIYEAERIAITILIILAAIAIWKVYTISIMAILRKLSESRDSDLDLSLMPIFSFIGKLILWVVGTAAILKLYGFDLQTILISAGFVTLGITMGAKTVLSQFFSGLSLLLTKRFAENDYISLNGKYYIVKKIGIMYTELMGTKKDRIISVPNNVMESATLVNTSDRMIKTYSIYVTINVPYESDLKQIESILLEMTHEYEAIMQDDKHKPVVRLTEFADSSIQLTLKFFLSQYANTSSMMKAIYIRLKENGIDIPFNRMEVDMIDKDMSEYQTRGIKGDECSV